MRKYFALLLLLPTAFMVMSGAANAQRKNTTSHDVKPACACVGEPNCQCSSQLERKATKGHHEKAGKAHDHHPDKGPHKGKKGSKDSQTPQKDKMKHWQAERIAEVDHRYNKLMQRIKDADLSKENAETLSELAIENRDLAKRQIEEVSKQLKTSHAKCMELGVKHKICKKLGKLLLDND